MFLFPVSHKSSLNEHLRVSENHRNWVAHAIPQVARERKTNRPRLLFSMSRKQMVDNELVLSPKRLSEPTVKKGGRTTKKAPPLTQVLQVHSSDEPESRSDEESTAFEVVEMQRDQETNVVDAENYPLCIETSSTTSNLENVIGRYSLADSTMSSPCQGEDPTQPPFNQTLVATFVLPDELAMESASSSAVFFTPSDLDASPIPSPHIAQASTSSTPPFPLHRVRAGLEDNKSNWKKNEPGNKNMDWMNTLTLTPAPSDDTLQINNTNEHGTCIGAGVKYQMNIIHEDMEMLQQDLQNTVMELLPSCRRPE